jgi:broad specificity phosphatase PhoE
MIAEEMRLRLHADYLRKMDIASSAQRLEVRVPFLDRKVLDWGSPRVLLVTHGISMMALRGPKSLRLPSRAGFRLWLFNPAMKHF